MATLAQLEREILDSAHDMIRNGKRNEIASQIRDLASMHLRQLIRGRVGGTVRIVEGDYFGETGRLIEIERWRCTVSVCGELVTVPMSWLRVD